MDNDLKNTEHEAAEKLLELLHNRIRNAKRAVLGFEGYTKGDYLINDNLHNKKVILLYPLMDFMRAKYGMHHHNFYAPNNNDTPENEALIMGIRVIGSHIDEPKFMIEVD